MRPSLLFTLVVCSGSEVQKRAGGAVAVPAPATSSLATQRRRHDGGELPNTVIFLSPSYLGSCPPLSPYLLALANLGWWALYKYGYRSSYQSVAGYRYGRYQLSISE